MYAPDYTCTLTLKIAMKTEDLNVTSLIFAKQNTSCYEFTIVLIFNI